MFLKPCCSSFYFCAVYCVGFFLSSSCLLRTQCYQCLWIVPSVFINVYPEENFHIYFCLQTDFLNTVVQDAFT